MAVERRGVGVEVIGVPDFMSNEQTIDKLLIHFLRPRNGGGEVLRVLYPLHNPGHAVIIYEEPNVAARVLQKRHHELEVGDQTFYLEVKPVDRPELDHPVEATLNLNTIADITELERLLHLYGLEVIQYGSRGGWARVKGSMMMLRPFMAEIQKLLKTQTPKLTRPSSSSSSPSSPLGSPSPPAADSKNSTYGSSARAKQNPSWSPAAPPYASPSPSLSPTSFSTSSSSWPAVDPVDRRRPTPKPEESPFVSFVTSSECLQYAQSYKKLGIEDVLAEHNAQMDVTVVDTDVSRVVVTGWRPRDAAAELQGLLSDVGAALHVRQVPLGGLDHDARVGVAKRIQELKPDFPMVLILQKGDGVRLVGPRLDCEQLKDGVLQERPAESQLQARAGRSRGKGRGDERAKEVKRRSRSTPRMHASGQGEPAAGADPTAASLNGGPSRPRAGHEGGRGAAPTYTEENYGGPEKPNLRPAKSPALLPSLMPGRIQKLWNKNNQSMV